MSSFFIILDSRNRLSGSNASFEVDFNTNNINDQEVAIGLDSAVIPNFIYPIRSGRNQIVFNEGKGNLTATIDEGFYDATNFAAAVKTALDAASTTPLVYTVSISTTTNRITISTTANFSINFASSSSEMWKILGFSQGITTTSALSCTGTMPVRLDNDEYLLLEIMNVSNDNLNTQFPSTSIVDTIPLNGAFGDVIYYKSNDVNNYSIAEHSDIMFLRVKLRDPNGYDVSLPENAHIMIKLRCVSTIMDV